MAKSIVSAPGALLARLIASRRLVPVPTDGSAVPLSSSTAVVTTMRWLTSYAPMSGAASRAKPRWSVAGANGRVAGVDRRAAGEQGHGLGRPAVVGQGAELQVGDGGDDDVAVDAVAQAAGAAGADQIVALAALTGSPTRSLGVTRSDSVLPPTMVLFSVAVPTVVDAAAARGPSCPTGWSWSASPCRSCRCRRRTRAELPDRVELVSVNVPKLSMPPPP